MTTATRSGSRLVDGAQALELSLGFALQPVALDSAGQQRGERLEEADIALGEATLTDGLDVEHADDRVVPDKRHGAHRGELRLVDAADPVEAPVAVDIEAGGGLSRSCHDAGNPHAQRQPCHANLLAIKPVRGRQRHARAVAIHQVERADLGLGGGSRPIDDRAHQLIPRPRRANKSGDLSQEFELLQPSVGVGGSQPSVLSRQWDSGDSAGQAGQAWDTAWDQARNVLGQQRSKNGQHQRHGRLTQDVDGR